MTGGPTRRDFIGALGAGLLLPAGVLARSAGGPLFRIRTITAGVELQRADDFHAVESALGFLARAQDAYRASGYEVQTIRIASQPLPQYLPDWRSRRGLADLVGLDQRAEEAGTVFSIGPVLTGDTHDRDFPDWAAELVRRTRNLSFSAQVASAATGVHRATALSAAEAIAAIAGATAGGEGNFRFAATALCPPGTPFFPAAYHTGTPAFSIGLETPPLLSAAFEGAGDIAAAQTRLTARMNAALAPVEALAVELSQVTGRRYLGIDASPAPGLDASIGAAIETLTGAPFGAPATLAGCAAITEVLQSLDIRTCGYSGLMLPVLEDPVLARRAAEGRYGIAELLLYSSVCGTGLDVVPLPGDSSVADLAATIADVAALATRYRKALSARLFPVPGSQAGDTVRFDNPHLTDAVVMALG